MTILDDFTEADCQTVLSQLAFLTPFLHTPTSPQKTAAADAKACFLLSAFKRHWDIAGMAQVNTKELLQVLGAVEALLHPLAILLSVALINLPTCLSHLAKICINTLLFPGLHAAFSWPPLRHAVAGKTLSGHRATVIKSLLTSTMLPSAIVLMRILCVLYHKSPKNTKTSINKAFEQQNSFFIRKESFLGICQNPIHYSLSHVIP